jgi:SAM-dependent methyltransferase
VQVTRKTDDGSLRKGSGHSLRRRLHAWWEGYELPTDGEAGAASADRRPPRSADPSADIDFDAPIEAPALSDWSAPRRELVQMLWGVGFSYPSEPEYVLDLVKPFGLTNANTMLEIGSGLGGGARLVASKIGCYVDAFEFDESLIKIAKDLAIEQDIDNKAIFKKFLPQALQLKQKFYDAALLREVIMCVDNKDEFFQTLIGALKPNTSLVISDFFLSDPEPGPEVEEAMAIEGRELFPCEVDTVANILAEFGLEIRINANETERYMDMVKGAWNIVAAKLKANPEDADPEMAEAMRAEIDLWTRRNKAFETGNLQVRRVVAFKRKEVM